MKKINKSNRFIRHCWDRRSLGRLLLSYVPLFALLALVCYRFRKVLLDPCAYLFATTGDGLKNIFNVAHYLKYDSGAATSGFNYPYGDHLLYTDSHPLWTFLQKQLDAIIPVASNAVGIINYAILLGAIVGAYLVFRLFRRLGIPVWFAGLGTFCITLLSPQWDRMGGHLSLSYLFVVPGILLLILNYANRPGLKTALFTGIYIFCTGGLHAYFLPMHFLLIFGFVFCQALMSRKHIRQNLPLILAGLIPLILFQIIQGSTDVFTERPTEIYGFFTYTASPASILMPRFEWAESLPYLLFKDRIQWEGRAYLGLPVVLLLLRGIFLLLNSRKLLWQRLRDTFPPSIISLLGAALLLLAFSMCIPFRFGMEWLVEILQPLKQIRALGRFSWPFYYVAGIVAVYFYYTLLSQQAKSGLRSTTIAVAVALSVIWIFEATRFFLVTTEDLIQSNVLLEENALLSEDVVAAHQAILALPLVAKGAEKLTRQADESGLDAAIPISYQSGLSIIATVSPRTSHPHALSAIQLISNPLIKKERLSDMDERPLLLVTDKRASLTQNETTLVHLASPLYEDGNIIVASLPISAFDQELDRALGLYQEKGSHEKNFLWVDYDSLQCSITLEGSGALHIDEKSTQVLAISNDMSPKLELSFWVYVDPHHQPMPHFLLETSDRDVWSQAGYLKSIDQTDVWQKWVRIAFEFECPLGESFRLTSGHAPFLMDNLLVRPAGSDVFMRSQQHVIYNNYLLSPD